MHACLGKVYALDVGLSDTLTSSKSAELKKVRLAKYGCVLKLPPWKLKNKALTKRPEGYVAHYHGTLISEFRNLERSA